MARARNHIAAPGFLAALAVLISACGAPRPPEIVYIAPGALSHYQQPGEFIIDGAYAEAPPERTVIENHLAVMKYQVTAREYAACVGAGACKPTALDEQRDLPVTGISYRDAQSYARWLSAVSGKAWRLPDDREWVYFSGPAFRQAIGARDKSEEKGWVDKWIGRYEQEADTQGEEIRTPHPAGHFGENEFGIADIGGNVWEWTQSCFTRVTLDRSLNPVSRNDFCGVMVLQGRHRAYMPDFIRDASAGGCGAGIPPDYTGLRLVRALHWHELAWQKLKNPFPRQNKA